MRYVIDITQKQAEEIENFIKKGRYNNFAQFLRRSSGVTLLCSYGMTLGMRS